MPYFRLTGSRRMLQAAGLAGALIVGSQTAEARPHGWQGPFGIFGTLFGHHPVRRVGTLRAHPNHRPAVVAGTAAPAGFTASASDAPLVAPPSLPGTVSQPSVAESVTMSAHPAIGY